MDAFEMQPKRRNLWRKLIRLDRLIRRTFSLIMLGVFVLVLIALAGTFWHFSQPPEVKPATLLVINLKGVIMDGPALDRGSQRLFGEDYQTRQGLINNIRKAMQDPRIVGILLKRTGGYGMNLTTLLDLRAELVKFKQTGKKVFAFLDNGYLGSYLLVSLAEKIFLSPAGDMFMPGWRAEVPFYKRMFDKIGVTPEFVAIGKYKTAPQIFTTEKMSDEYREVLNELLDAYYNMTVEKIASGRNVPVDKVKAWIDNGLFTAGDALRAGLVDELVYESDLEKKLQDALTPDKKRGKTTPTPQADEKADDAEAKPNTINNAQYARVEVTAPGLHDKGPKIAVVYAQGSIVTGKSVPPPTGGMIGSDSMTELFQTLAKDQDIKGIILRIDSGGGGAEASELIRNSILEAKRKKPIVVSMADAAASGGYMIATPADKIVADPLTLTGSIGIFGGKFSLKGLYDFLGINFESVQRGQNAGLLTPTRLHTPEEQERFRQFIQQGYDKFITGVAQDRKMTVEAVDQIAQGRVWTGKQAKERGLVDELGGLDAAIAVMKQTLQIPADQDVQIVDYPEPEDPFKFLVRRFRETFLDAKLPLEVQRLRSQLETLARLQEETLFAWLPCRLVFDGENLAP